MIFSGKFHKLNENFLTENVIHFIETPRRRAVGNPVQASVGVELPDLASDTIVTVVIVKIDLPSNSITLKDGNGTLWTFVVDRQYFDLSRYKVGQKAAATISRTVITDKVSRARITKNRLIRLQ